jgi:hypothetical protein
VALVALFWGCLVPFIGQLGRSFSRVMMPLFLSLPRYSGLQY